MCQRQIPRHHLLNLRTKWELASGSWKPPTWDIVGRCVLPPPRLYQDISDRYYTDWLHTTPPTSAENQIYVRESAHDIEYQTSDFDFPEPLKSELANEGRDKVNLTDVGSRLIRHYGIRDRTSRQVAILFLKKNADFTRKAFDRWFPRQHDGLVSIAREFELQQLRLVTLQDINVGALSDRLLGTIARVIQANTCFAVGTLGDVVSQWLETLSPLTTKNYTRAYIGCVVLEEQSEVLMKHHSDWLALLGEPDAPHRHKQHLASVLGKPLTAQEYMSLGLILKDQRVSCETQEHWGMKEYLANIIFDDLDFGHFHPPLRQTLVKICKTDGYNKLLPETVNLLGKLLYTELSFLLSLLPSDLFYSLTPDVLLALHTKPLAVLRRSAFVYWDGYLSDSGDRLSGLNVPHPEDVKWAYRTLDGLVAPEAFRLKRRIAQMMVSSSDFIGTLRSIFLDTYWRKNNTTFNPQ
ncbi:UNVERIFIED_CONTAM: hypothetical protein FKN15_003204 [Acipenser sinensis]